MGFFQRWQQRIDDVEKHKDEIDVQKPNESNEVSVPADETEMLAVPDSSNAVVDEPQALTLPDPEQVAEGDSFAQFMQPEVDPKLRQKALRTLFQQPHYREREEIDFSSFPKIEVNEVERLLDNMFRYSRTKPEDETETETETEIEADLSAEHDDEHVLSKPNKDSDPIT